MASRKLNRTLWGEILITLMSEAVLTSDLVYNLNWPDREIRLALITMHQYDLITPVAVRTERGLPPDRFGYGQDILWQKSWHSEHHAQSVPDCHGCWVREELNLLEILVE